MSTISVETFGQDVRFAFRPLHPGDVESFVLCDGRPVGFLEDDGSFVDPSCSAVDADNHIRAWQQRL